MLLVVKTGPGEVELNWSWLPTFMTMNAPLLRQVEQQVVVEFAGQPLDLQALHLRVTQLLVDAYPCVTGLSGYLTALEQVELADEGVAQQAQG
jgi:hypothetical protein